MKVLLVSFLDPEVRIPLTWPFGTYGLPMTKSGCPNGNFWHEGTRFHDTEDEDPDNLWSDPYDLAGNRYDRHGTKVLHEDTE